MSETAELEVERQGGVVVARVGGEIDIARVETLRSDLVADLSNQDTALVVDMTGSSYLDSAGVNMLFELAEALDRRQIQIAAVIPQEGIVARVAALVSLESALPVHPSVEDAVATLGASAGGVSP
jgi:anti-sigma B factor antagonist